MTLAAEEAEDLVRAATRAARCLMVGHLLLYHPAVVKMNQLVASEEIGELFYLYSQRLNLGQVRKDENALWSFGPHDVAVALYMFGCEPEMVTAKGEAFLQKGIVDVVFVTLHFPRRKLAHIHLSWLDPHKVRRTTLVGSRKMVVFDDGGGFLGSRDGLRGRSGRDRRGNARLAFLAYRERGVGRPAVFHWPERLYRPRRRRGRRRQNPEQRLDLRGRDAGKRRVLRAISGIHERDQSPQSYLPKA